MAAVSQFDPYHKWLGIPPDEQPPHHYRLLGIQVFETDGDVIQSAADQRMAHVRTFQSGAHGDASQKILNELAAARVCLLRPERKAPYDAELKQRLAARQAAKVAVPVATIPSASPPSAVDFDFDQTTSSTRRRTKREKSTAIWATVLIVVLLPVAAGALWILIHALRQESGDAPPVANRTSGSEQPKPGSATSNTTGSDPKQPHGTKVINQGNVPPAATGARPAPSTTQSSSVLDDSDTVGFSLRGDGWNRRTATDSYRGSYHSHPSGQGQSVASWKFDGLQPGTRYDVFATWPANPSNAVKAQYQASDSQRLSLAVNVNQISAPRSDKLVEGQPFQRLGGVSCQSGTITVRLSDAADANIVADAIWISPAGPAENRVAGAPPEVQIQPRPNRTVMQQPPAVEAAVPPVATGQPNAAVTPNDSARSIAQTRPDDPTWLAQFKQPVTATVLGNADARALVATLDMENSAAFWDLDKRVQANRVEANRVGGMRTKYLSAAAVPGQNLFFLGGENGFVTVYDLRKNQPFIHNFWTGVGPITALAASADGRALAIGGRDRVRLYRYQILEGEQRVTTDSLADWTGFASPVTALVVSPDAKRIIAGCGGTSEGNAFRSSEDMTVHAYDVLTKTMKDFPGHSGSVWSMAISGDGERLATASSDGKVRVWDTAKANKLEEMSGHDGAVLSIAISEDGGTIVSGGEDATVRVWDSRTGRARNILRGHRSPIRAIAYDAVTKRILSGSQDGELRLFDAIVRPIVPRDEVPFASKRLPVPTDEQLADARKLLREIYESDLANAKTSTEKLAMVDKLLANVPKSNDATEQFVLIDAARKMAIDVGDVGRTLSTVRDQSEKYEVDYWKSAADSFDELVKAATTAPLRKQLADTALEQANLAITEDRFEEAKRILANGLAVARKASDPGIIRQITSRTKEVTELVKTFADVQKGIETLQTSPDDAAANLAVGRHQCFTHLDWSQGLPHLAKCGDEKLCTAAQSDLKMPTTADEQTKVADQWWDLAASAEGMPKAAMLERAEYWYREALPQLSGLALTKVKKRIDDLDGTVDAAGNAGSGPKQESPAATMRSLVLKTRMAVKANNLTRSAIYGSRNTQNMFHDVPQGGLLLAGFNYAVENGQRVVSVQPIYLSPKGPLSGNIYGDPTRGAAGKVEAPKGYAVGGLEVCGDGGVWGFTVIFMKIGKTGLDSADTQRSPLIGNNNSSRNETLGGDGQPVVGIFGNVRQGNWLDGLGLVQVTK